MTMYLRVNPITCSAHGLCAELYPEGVQLDDWGYPIIKEAQVQPHELAHVKAGGRPVPDAGPEVGACLTPETAESEPAHDVPCDVEVDGPVASGFSGARLASAFIAASMASSRSVISASMLSALASNSASASCSGSCSSRTKRDAMAAVTRAMRAKPDTMRTDERMRPGTDSGASPMNPTVLISESAHHTPSQ